MEERASQGFVWIPDSVLSSPHAWSSNLSYWHEILQWSHDCKIPAVTEYLYHSFPLHNLPGNFSYYQGRGTGQQLSTSTREKSPAGVNLCYTVVRVSHMVKNVHSKAEDVFPLFYVKDSRPLAYLLTYLLYTILHVYSCMRKFARFIFRTNKY